MLQIDFSRRNALESVQNNGAKAFDVNEKRELVVGVMTENVVSRASKAKKN